MAEELNDAEFWLPAEFLDDDEELFSEGEGKGSGGALASTGGGGGGGVAKTWFDGEFPYGFGLDLGSPVDSAMGTESDEEEYTGGLPSLMKKPFLQEEDVKDWSLFGGRSPKVLSGSPQSTLCGVDSWTGSNGESPRGTSKVSSPPSTPPLEQPKDDALDLLCAAAGEVVRMRLHEQEQKPKPEDPGILGAPKQSSAPISAPSKKNSTTGYYACTIPTLQQLKFEQLKQQQLMRQQSSAAWVRQSKTRGDGGGLYGDARSGRPLGLPASAWPPLQQQQQQQTLQPGSGMRAIFLDSSGKRKESTGTGVFLPRRVGDLPESGKKSGCSTVLLPAKVVQALNLNMDELSANPRFPGGFIIDHDGMLTRGAATLSQQKRSHHLRPQTTAVTAHDCRLPSEWTY